ncbi:MAG: alanine racemase [Tateyamaria sp.]|uniref:alanine racemase n=1 Tax=Tateyamaria sp. TaxID=1929288 RepID=UPI0032935433
MSETHHPSIFEHYLDPRGNVVIGGRPATDWLDGSGRPHFLYSKSRLAQRIADLRAALPNSMGLNYAVKSNPFEHMLQTIDPLIDGFDIASIGEFRRLLAAGCAQQNISFAGPGKSLAEVSEAAAQDVKIIVESPHQLSLCEQVGSQLGRTVRAMVRINDQKARPGGGLSMAGNKTVFGWDLADFQENGVAAFAAAPHVEFGGLHIFYGSQILQPSAIAENLRISVETIEALHLPSAPNVINLGGGLGVPYGPKDVPLDLQDISTAWHKSSQKLLDRFPQTKLCVELGRYISSEAGILIVEVLDKKTIGGTHFLVCSGGLQNFAAATGNFGQVLRRNHPIRSARASSAPGTFTVTGPLCTPMDVFARDTALPAPQIGDHIVVFQAGAYGVTASPTSFLSHPQAVEKMVD